MALDTATVTLDIADLLGGDFRPDRTSVRATTNAEMVIDTAGNRIRLGSGTAALNPDGTAELEVWVPGAGSNPASWQTSIHVSFPDPSTQSGRGTRTFGPFTITGDANLADLVAEMPVQPEYAAAVFDLIQGYDDHGNVSGVLTLDPAIGTHVLDATGPLLVTLDDAPNGAIVTLLVTSGADDVTVDDVEATLTDGAFATFVRIRGSWVLASAGSGGEPATPDATPPAAVTDLAATGGVGTIDLTWSAVTDAESTVHYRYRAWLTSGGASGTWTSTNSTSAALTGLASGAYTAEVYAYSNGGASATDTATATVASPPLDWEPSELTGLAAWWDADDATTFTYSGGTTVSEWRDKSGNSRHLTASTSEKRPARSSTINGRTAVLFNGTSHTMVTPAYTPTKPCTLLMVVRNTASTSSPYRQIITAKPVDGGVARDAFGNLSIAQGIEFLPGIAISAGAHALAVVINNASSKAAADSGAWITGALADWTGFGSQGWNVGALNTDNGAGSQFWQGEICEIVHVNASLSDSDLADWFDYASTKWGTP